MRSWWLLPTCSQWGLDMWQKLQCSFCLTGWGWWVGKQMNRCYMCQGDNYASLRVHHSNTYMPLDQPRARFYINPLRPKRQYNGFVNYEQYYT